MFRLVRWVFFFAIVGGVAAGGYYWRESRDADRRERWSALPRTEARRDDLVITVDEIGVLSVRVRQVVRCAIHGDITKLAEHGEWVEKGDPVIWYSIERLEEQFDEDIANLKEAQTDIDRINAYLGRMLDNQNMDTEMQLANLFYQRLRLEDMVQKLTVNEALSEEEMIAARQVEEYRLKASGSSNQALQREFGFQSSIKDQSADRQSRTRSIRTAIKRRESAFGRAQRAADRITSAVAVAPCSGIFQRQYTYDRATHQPTPLKVGSHVQEGDELAFIPDLSTIMAESQVTESDVRRATVGTTATLRLDAIPDVVFTGSIVSVGSAAIERDRSPAGAILASEDLEHEKVFAIQVDFQATDERLRPGMTTSISLEVDRKRNTVIVPFEAIFRDNGDTVVYRDLGDRAETVKVRTGLHTNTEAEIVEGISPGDVLLLVAPETAENG